MLVKKVVLDPVESVHNVRVFRNPSFFLNIDPARVRVPFEYYLLTTKEYLTITLEPKDGTREFLLLSQKTATCPCLEMLGRRKGEANLLDSYACSSSKLVAHIEM